MNSMKAYPIGDYEHICLSSEEEVELGTIPANDSISAVLEQGGKDMKQRLTLFEHNRLGVETDKGNEHEFHLVFLDPRPTTPPSRLPWAITCAAGSVTLTLSLLAWSRFPELSPEILVAMALSLIATIASFAVAWHRSFNKLVFYTRHGRIPVLHLMRHRPDRQRAAHFIDALERSIRKAIAQQQAPRSHFLREEMREHRRLLAEGVVGPQEFEAAKARILRAHG